MDSRFVRLSEAGSWLKAERTRAGLSVREVAERTGATTQAVYNWEAGRTGVTDESADRLAEILGLDVIDVRRNLGLWVPDNEHAPTPEPADTTDADPLAGLPDDPDERLRALSDRLQRVTQAIAEEMDHLARLRRAADEDRPHSA